MRLTEAKTSVDGKTLHCEFDDGRACSFQYPITLKAKSGRLAQYAVEAQAWLDLGNVPEPIRTEAEEAMDRKVADYLSKAEREREVAVMQRAKELADTDNEADVSAALDARLTALTDTDRTK